MAMQNKIIGRDPSCDFVILDPQNRVSRKHAEIQKIDGHFTIKDLGSKNGTYLNGRILPPNQGIKVELRDKITLSIDYALDLISIFDNETTRLFSSNNELVFSSDHKVTVHEKDRTVVFDSDKTCIGDIADLDSTQYVTVGRAPDNKEIIDNLSVSRHHCKLRLISPLVLEVVDLGSTNGTYVDGEKLAPNQKQMVSSNVVIRLGKDQILNFTEIFPNILHVRKHKFHRQEDAGTHGPRDANSFERQTFNELESIWKDYNQRQIRARDTSTGFALGGAALGVGAAVFATAVAGPFGLLFTAGGGILGKYLGDRESNKIRNDLTFEDIFLATYSCPRCKESFQKKPWITIRECYKCRLKFR